MSRKPTAFELQGGTGNQLFQYFAGQYYSKNNKVIFRVEENAISQIGFGIEQFELPKFQKVIISRSGSLVGFADRVYKFTMRKSKLFRNLNLRLFGVFQASVVGFTPELDRFSNLTRVLGYFQTYKYLPTHISKFGLTLKETNSNLNSLLEELHHDTPIVIHIRGGDYRFLTETFGVLSSEYYRNAIEELRYFDKPENIWVFTNDICLAEEIIDELQLTKARVLVDEHLNSAETLYLMSQARRIVISNSTYSWWAAYLNGEHKEVVAPSQWFRSMSDPEKLIPSNWTRVNSSWMI